MDNGPPYIVKFFNLPVSCNDEFIEDLFRSRYTPFVKFKIVFDPASQPLETGVVKKIAFVELGSFNDQSRVLKWHDLNYSGSRRVVIEMADFNDFKNCMAFNQEHEQQLREVEREFLSGRNRHWDDHRQSHNGYNRGAPIERPDPVSRIQNLPLLQRAKPEIQSPVLQKPEHHKPNPFGNAKPVDILLKQHEIEKQLITINHTTVKTPGSHMEKTVTNKPEQKSAEVHEAAEVAPEKEHETAKESSLTPGFTPAPIPSSVYGQKQSLADILANNDSDLALSPKPTRKSNTATPKPQAKPTILQKKKPTARHLDISADQTPDSVNDHAEVSSAPETADLEAPEAEVKPSSDENVGHSESRTETKSEADAVLAEPSEQVSKDADGGADANEKDEKKDRKPSSGLRDRRKSRDSKRRSSRARNSERPPREETRQTRAQPLSERNTLFSSGERPPRDETRQARAQHLSERNTLFSSGDRPDFKKQLSEITHALEKEHIGSRRGGRGGLGRGARQGRGDRSEGQSNEHKELRRETNGAKSEGGRGSHGSNGASRSAEGSKRAELNGAEAAKRPDTPKGSEGKRPESSRRKPRERGEQRKADGETQADRKTEEKTGEKPKGGGRGLRGGRSSRYGRGRREGNSSNVQQAPAGTG